MKEPFRHDVEIWLFQFLQNILKIIDAQSLTEQLLQPLKRLG